MDRRGTPSNLSANFQRLFRIRVALKEAERNETFRIRHDVYCRELRWEPEQPNGMETDEYDAHSVHCLMQTNDERQQCVGSLRLVLPNPHNPTGLLPVEIGCAETLDRAMLNSLQLDRRRLAEVSRLAITSGFRRRKNEQNSRDVDAAEQSRFQFILVGLYLAGLAVAEKLGIESALMLTEPRLAQHLNRLGFDIRQVGGPIEHRGARIPSVLYKQKFEAQIFRPWLRPMWQAIRTSVREDFACAGPNAIPWLTSETRLDESDISRIPLVPELDEDSFVEAHV